MKIKEPKYKYQAVMLIDDNDLDNFINEKIIEASHFSKKIYVNSSAKSALEFLQNLVTMGGADLLMYPKVIFIDINMPIMDGFQFIEYYKKNLEKMINAPKLVILTSSVYQEDKYKAMAISEDIIFLNKPLTKILLEKVY
ncbi:MAG: response regulator [Bacteroidetes bacterium]|nr:response regulator [Bacteroidota bacterium]